MKALFAFLCLVLLNGNASAQELSCLAKNSAPGSYVEISTNEKKILTISLVSPNPISALEKHTKILFSEPDHIYGGFKAGSCYWNDNDFSPESNTAVLSTACIGSNVAGNVLFNLKLLPDHSGSAHLVLSGPTGTQYEWRLDLDSCQ